jgi:putative transposase
LRALVLAERQAVLDVLHSERFVDQSPAEVQATLLEEQTYLCSTRTMYRILDAAQEVRERRDQARHPAYAKPELVATAPNQIWSWDITKLKGPIPYLYYVSNDNPFSEAQFCTFKWWRPTRTLACPAPDRRDVL